jgi:membrane dipeptidase
MKKNLLIGLLITIMVLFGVFFLVVPVQVDKRLNKVTTESINTPSDRAKDLHKTLLIADLHADSLLWNRDLLKRSDRGHVDVPRLIEGGVALQGFTLVTKTPRNLNIETNDDSTDNITLLSIAQMWPWTTWTSLKERALYHGKFILIKTAAGLSTYIEQRRKNSQITAGFLGIEGAHALEGELNNIDVLFNAGIRMISPSHFFDTEMGGSAHGLHKGGLTPLGKEMIKRMEAKGMILDLAHASSNVITDALSITTRPVLISHTGVKGTCNNNRNLSDEQIKGIAKSGGLIGIGYWDTATCGKDAQAIAQAIKYTVNLVGVEHVALGSDYDGAVTVPFDTTKLIAITDALIAEGFSEQQIRMIMGENVIRLLLKLLP